MAIEPEDDVGIDAPVQALCDAIATNPAGDDTFTAVAPDWFGERVFGGMVVAQALDAASRTVSGAAPHSMHVYFLGAMRPGPVGLAVSPLRDGRTFTTRHVTSAQEGRTALWGAVSFHAPEAGDEYQLAAPDVPGPDACAPSEWAPPPFDLRDIGPTERRPDGTYRSTHRFWVRTVEPMPEDPRAHLGVAAFLSDMTGAGFRPHSLGEWGTHTDASIDHAVWFHHPLRVDEWVLADFHAVHNGSGRATIRGELFDAAGALCLSMAQELLIRPLAEPRPPVMPGI